MAKRKKESKGIFTAVLSLILGTFALMLLLEMDYDIIPFIDLTVSGPLHTVLLFIVIVAFVWLALLLIGRLVEAALGPKIGSYASVRSGWLAISYVIWALVLVLLFFSYFGDITSSVLSIGLIGAALTFVLQKPLINILGWLFITYNRAYKIGDRITLGNTTGYITDIRVMHTSLYEIGEWMQGDTFTGRITMVPNGLIFDGAVQNYTKDSPFIWDEVTNMVTFESDVDKAKLLMCQAVTEVVGSLMEKNFEAYRSRLELHDLDEMLPSEPQIRFEFKESGVDVSVFYWCPAEHRRRIRSDIVEGIWRRFVQDPSVEIAYPHMEITGKNLK